MTSFLRLKLAPRWFSGSVFASQSLGECMAGSIGLPIRSGRTDVPRPAHRKGYFWHLLYPLHRYQPLAPNFRNPRGGLPLLDAMKRRSTTSHSSAGNPPTPQQSVLRWLRSILRSKKNVYPARTSASRKLSWAKEISFDSSLHSLSSSSSSSVVRTQLVIMHRPSSSRLVTLAPRFPSLPLVSMAS